jgi:hypothetical protein
MNDIKNNVLNNWNLDNWSISKKLFKKITEILPYNSTILELGSGAGTNELSKLYNIISVENDKEYINKYNSKYIEVPLVNLTDNKLIDFPEDITWFDSQVFKEKIKDLKYDLILIDGPKGFRGGLWYVKEILSKDVIYVFDDIHDEHHLKLAQLFADYLNKKLEIFDACSGTNDGKLYGIII